MLPGCTNATRTVGPTAGAGPSRNQAGPIPAQTSATPRAECDPTHPGPGSRRDRRVHRDDKETRQPYPTE